MKGVICLLVVAFVAVEAIPDYYGLPTGPYCASRRDGCCRGRDDKCSYPILGTLCYCDEFCDRHNAEDCCPDFWTHCRGLPPPTTTTWRPITTRRTTTPRPPEEKTCPLYKGKYVIPNRPFQDNCNECICESIDNEKLDIMCSKHECMIDQNIINRVNENYGQYAWHARNYSEFWGKKLDDGVIFKLGSKNPSNTILTMEPIKKIYDPERLPKHFDSMAKWEKLSPIKNQKWCGASWAISTVDVASDRLFIMSNGTEDIQMSAQHLLSCNNRDQQGCNGGYIDRAWWYIRKYGVVDEDCYEYTAKKTKCKIPRKTYFLTQYCDPPEYPWRKRLYKTSPVYRLGNVTDIMFEIMQNGPVQATMKVYQDFFMYDGGVYKHSGLSKGTHYEDNYHSVRIVGWGIDDSYNPPLKYWKVANSWGEDWGEDGYFRIVRGANECDIEKFVLGAWVPPAVPEKQREFRSFINYPRSKLHKHHHKRW